MMTYWKNSIFAISQRIYETNKFFFEKKMKLFAIKKFLISNHTCLTVTGLESALKKDKKSRKNKLLTEYEIILNVHSEQDLT